MRRLSIRHRAFAAESLGIAFSHLRTAQLLVKEHDYASAVARMYYAAFFAAKAALGDLGRRSKKHSYWLSQFNKRFGKRKSWVPQTYVRMLNILSKAREEHDYYGSLSHNAREAKSLLRRTTDFLKKVRGNTPLVHYPEFIADFLGTYPHVLALEFDYYCPKSYLHKERVQVQIQARHYTPTYFRRISKSGREAAKALNFSREEDYVIGWNNRLGQSGDGYLLFLDIDEADEANVKSALKDRKGWVFKSGNGYHFIGQEILTSEKIWLRRFLQAAKSKKLKQLVDHRHVDFSQRRGYTTLRVSQSDVKEFKPFLCWDNT